MKTDHDLEFDFARPAADPLKPLRALVYDCWYDRFKGIICNIAVKDGVVSKGKMVWVDLFPCRKSFLPVNFYRIWEVRTCILLFLGDRVTFHHAHQHFDVQEIGILYPEPTPTNIL